MAPLSHEETSGPDLDGVSLFSCGDSSLGVKVILQRLVTLKDNLETVLQMGKISTTKRKI